MAWISKNQQYLSYSEAMSNAQIVINQLINTKNGWSKESLSALVGNMYRESTVNPDLYEMGYDWEDDRGYGLCQWTPRSKLSNWADSEGLDYRLGDTQVKRIHYEALNNIQWLNDTNFYHNPTGHIYSFTEFITNSKGYSLEELTIDFCWHYERPGIEYGEESLITKGIPFAKDAYANLDFTGSGTTKMVIPVKNATADNVTELYGWRTHPITGERNFHRAIDIANGCGVGVVSSLPGTVIRADVIYVDNPFGGTTGYGNVVEIKHTNGYSTIYAHLDSVFVQVGDVVPINNVIGSVGSTGASTGCHLHFEIKKEGYVDEGGGNGIDPYPYIFGNQGIDLGGGDNGDNTNIIKKKREYIHVSRRVENQTRRRYI